VVIPAHNGASLLPECLRSVLGSNVRVVVVDDASTDNTGDVCRGYPGVTLVSLKSNVGFGGACDAGIRGSSTPYCLLLNTDATLRPGTLDALVEQATAENFTVLGPRILNPDGSLQSVGLSADILGEPGRSRPGAEPFYVSGAALLIRRADYDRLGGFDVRYFMFYEEFDLQWRARLAGLKVGVLESVAVAHAGGATIAGGVPDRNVYRVGWDRLYLGRRNQLATLLKNQSAVSLFAVLPLWLVSGLVESVGATVLGHPGYGSIYVRAVYWNARNLGDTWRRRRHAQRLRRVSDREIHRLFLPAFRRIRVGIRILRGAQRLRIER
jgi:glycosyltransferase involved in cell wall biosynthesis